MTSFQVDVCISLGLGSVPYSGVGSQSSTGQATDGQVFCQAKLVWLFWRQESNAGYTWPWMWSLDLMVDKDNLAWCPVKKPGQNLHLCIPSSLDKTKANLLAGFWKADTCFWFKETRTWKMYSFPRCFVLVSETPLPLSFWKRDLVYNSLK